MSESILKSLNEAASRVHEENYQEIKSRLDVLAQRTLKHSNIKVEDNEDNKKRAVMV